MKPTASTGLVVLTPCFFCYEANIKAAEFRQFFKVHIFLPKLERETQTNGL